MDSHITKYNPYLRYLNDFPHIDYILHHLFIPTSVVFTWNRISMVLQGAFFHFFDWEGISGCDVDENVISIRCEDINHLVLPVEDANNQFSSTHLIHSFSFRNHAVNKAMIVSTMSSDLAEDLTTSNPDIGSSEILRNRMVSNSISSPSGYHPLYSTSRPSVESSIPGNASHSKSMSFDTSTPKGLPSGQKRYRSPSNVIGSIVTNRRPYLRSNASVNTLFSSSGDSPLDSPTITRPIPLIPDMHESPIPIESA